MEQNWTHRKFRTVRAKDSSETYNCILLIFIKYVMEKQIEIFKSKDNQIELNVQFDEDTVWLSQEQIANLFERNRVAVTQHIGNIFKEGELEEKVVCKDFLHTTEHGAIKGKTQTRIIKHYNLDVIISVGYRVKSQRGTQFRQWATQRLKDYLVQGYAINEKRLAQKQQEIEYLKTGIRILNRAKRRQPKFPVPSAQQSIHRKSPLRQS